MSTNMYPGRIFFFQDGQSLNCVLNANFGQPLTELNANFLDGDAKMMGDYREFFGVSDLPDWLLPTSKA